MAVNNHTGIHTVVRFASYNMRGFSGGFSMLHETGDIILIPHNIFLFLNFLCLVREDRRTSVVPVGLMSEQCFPTELLMCGIVCQILVVLLVY